ncbi:hypothetical protein ES703_123462 [subsurface metagenome]
MSHVGMATQRMLEMIGRAGYAYPTKPMGEVFFVDHTNGDNDHDGQNKDSPLQTITEALTRCVDSRDDMILVLNCWDSEPDTITVNKRMVHIIGLGIQGGLGASLPAIGDTPVFTLPAAGSKVEIAGFSIGGGNDCPGIELNNNYGSWIHNCWFGHVGVGQTPRDGITNDVPAGNHNYNGIRIENCKFLGNHQGKGHGTLSRYGIHFGGSGINGQDAHILNNRFMNCSYAIRIVYGLDQIIEHNYIKIPVDDAIGRGIYYHAGTGSLIVENKATDDGADAMANAAFYDNQVANNAWLCNQEGILDVFPDTSL